VRGPGVDAAAAPRGVIPIAEAAASAQATIKAQRTSLKAPCTARYPTGVPSRATRTLTPKTVPTCRLMLTMALPVAARAGGRSVVAADKMVGSARPTPAPPMIEQGSISAAYDGSGPSRKPLSATPLPSRRHPAAAIHPTETRCATLCATAANIGTIRGPGATPSPVRRAV